MRLIEVFEQIFFNRKTYRVEKEFSQTMMTLITFLLWISPGLGDDKPPDCNAEDPAFCTSHCSYFWEKCNGNADCSYDLCSYLHPTLPPRYWHRCLDLINDCANDYRISEKRAILNKNVAYLLFKLHPYLNQTSQFGFLASGRIRRITGNFGSEFLGKRSNNNPTRLSGSGRTTQNPSNNKPKPKFYSLPLDQFSKTKIVKRAEENFQQLDNFKNKRGGGKEKIILGSEFLGKRGYYQSRGRQLSGNEFLGKRNEDVFEGSEFLGKRVDQVFGNELLGKRQNEPFMGTELLGKKSTQDPRPEIFKRFGNELLGKRLGQESSEEPEFKNLRLWLTNNLIDKYFPSYLSDNGKFVRDSPICDGSKIGSCGESDTKEVFSTNEQEEINHWNKRYKF